MSVEITTIVDEGTTEIEVTGSRDVAVVVRSASGERIYLPPEEFTQNLEASPYSGGVYAQASESDTEASPYREAAESTRGVVTTPQGFRIHHDAPITELDVYRAND